MYEYKKLYSCYNLLLDIIKQKVFAIEFDEVWPFHTDNKDLTKFANKILIKEKLKQKNLKKCSLHKNVINVKIQ